MLVSQWYAEQFSFMQLAIRTEEKVQAWRQEVDDDTKTSGLLAQFGCFVHETECLV